MQQLVDSEDAVVALSEVLAWTVLSFHRLQRCRQRVGTISLSYVCPPTPCAYPPTSCLAKMSAKMACRNHESGFRLPTKIEMLKSFVVKFDYRNQNSNVFQLPFLMHCIPNFKCSINERLGEVAHTRFRNVKRQLVPSLQWWPCD